MTRTALVGNPNSGKTTIFNLLTGKNLRTGNYNGVTVSAYEARLTKNDILCDLPGVFSLDPETEDERAACEYLRERADRAVIVTDALSPEKIAPIAKEIHKMQIPCVAVVTMSDVLKRRGGETDLARLSRELGIETTLKCRRRELMKFILSSEYRVVREASEDGLRECVVEGRGDVLSPLDRAILMRGLGFLLPVLLLLPIIFISSVLSPALGRLLNELLDGITAFVMPRLLFLPELPRGFISEAVFGGALTVLEFLPTFVLISAYLTFIEESGITSRLCALISPLASFMKVSPRAFTSFLLGFGCTVPAVTSLRAVDRRSAEAAAYILPFFQCGAKAPVFLTFISVFFGSHSVSALLLIYLGGILSAVLLSPVFGRSEEGEIIELPAYRGVRLRDILRCAFDKFTECGRKIVLVLLSLSALVWLSRNFDLTLTPVSEVSKSALYRAGEIISPVFSPLGFGSREAAVSLICGLLAKEGALTSLAVCAGRDGVSFVLGELFTPASAVSYLVFFSLYPPCAASLSAYMSEFGLTHTLKCVFVWFAIAYLLSAVSYRAALFFMTIAQ